MQELGPIRFVTVHCSASPNGELCPMSKVKELHTSSQDTVVDWFGKRINGFAWDGVGYHYGIQPCGTIEHGLSLNELGRHVKGHNKNNVGIYLAGTDLFSIAQFEALRGKINTLRLDHDIKLWDVKCHYQFPSARGKTCPNIEINHLLGWLFTRDERSIKNYLTTEMRSLD